MQIKWFTSDLHFFQKSITKYTNRSVETTAEEHDTWLRDLWNKQVKPGDLVYIIGDFSFAKKYDQLANLLKELNGQKIIIKGNHDDERWLNNLTKENLIAKWAYYDEVDVNGIRTCLFHNAISNWHNQHRGYFHLHGHAHGTHKHDRGFMLDVGIDNSFNIYGFHKFFNQSDIIEYMSKKTIYIADGREIR